MWVYNVCFQSQQSAAVEIFSAVEVYASLIPRTMDQNFGDEKNGNVKLLKQYSTEGLGKVLQAIDKSVCALQ